MSLPRPLLALLLLLATSAHAHPGHGAVQAWHWHTGDSSGLLMVAVLATLALWISRKG